MVPPVRVRGWQEGWLSTVQSVWHNEGSKFGYPGHLQRTHWGRDCQGPNYKTFYRYLLPYVTIFVIFCTLLLICHFVNFMSHQFPCNVCAIPVFCMQLRSASFYPNVTTLRSGLCYRKSDCRLSVCRPLMFVHLTQGVEAFGKISSPLCILTMLWPACKILRRSYRPSGALNKRKSGSKIERFWTCRRLHLTNGTRHGLGYNDTWRIHWCNFQWPWPTQNLDFKVIGVFRRP